MLVRLDIGKIADQPAGTLPYTDERRVGIARALVMDPAFVLLDEPAAGMSDHECEELTTLISSIPTDFGCGVLLIEHNMAVVMKICDRVHVLDGGRTLAEGTPEQIRCSEAVMTAYLGSEM
jgi:branched-chain amino acid transport system ATP-binding protein